MILMRKIFLLFFLLSTSYNLCATHIVGGVINYECLGGNNYKIKLKLYRDCFGGLAPFDEPASLGVFASNGSYLNEYLIYITNDWRIPNSVNTACFTPTQNNVCVEEGIYETTITLPPRIGGYTLAYQRCCRNNSIINIVNPWDVGATIVAKVPGSEVVTACNSNPVFEALPPNFLCLGSPLTFDHSAKDADGDSLVYELCAPFDGATPNNPKPNANNFTNYFPVNWVAPYSTANQIAANPALQINSATGIITGTPTIQGQWVIGVCVREFRNGVLLSTTMRDYQFNVISCPGLVTASMSAQGTSPTSTPSYTIACNGLTVNFINNSFNASTYYWDFGDQGNTTDNSTLTNPSYTYPAPGVYSVMLIAYNSDKSCSDTSYINLAVDIPANPDFEVPAGVCSGTEISFNATGNSTSGATFSWSFGGATPNTSTLKNPTGIKFPSPGNYTITLTITESNGCVKSKQKTLSISSKATASIDPQQQFCKGLTVTFSQNSLNTNSYLWNFGGTGTATNSQPTHTFPSYGTYAITLIANPGSPCADTTISNFEVRPLVEANFTPPTDNCPKSAVNFSAFGTFGPYATFQWNFLNANPSSSTIQNPTGISYSTDGTFSVTLVVSEDGCSDTINKSISIFKNPVAQIAPQTSFCEGYNYSFNNLSTNANSWLWNFGGSNISSLKDPSFTFPSQGNYDVMLIANPGSACADTTVSQIKIDPELLPIATTNNDSCLKANKIFNAGGLYGPGAIFNWNFFGGTPAISSDVSVEIKYNSIGSYNAILVVSENGCTRSDTILVNIVPGPKADIVPQQDHCEGMTYTFTNLSTGAGNFLWNFGNTQTSIAVNPTHTYPDSGIFNVMLIADPGTVCADTAFQPFKVYPLIVPNFSIPTLTCVKFANFDFFATGAHTPDAVFAWEFPRAAPSFSSLQNPQGIKYNEGDTFVVKLYISEFGCTKMRIDSFFVEPDPIAKIQEQQLFCWGKEYQFENISEHANNFIWYFNDPLFPDSTSFDSLPIFAFSDYGFYTVKLYAYSPSGCIDSTDTQLKIDPLLWPEIETDFVQCITLNNFDFKAAGSFQSFAQFEWNFQNANISSSTNQNVNNVNFNNGIGFYNVSLTISENGCVRTKSIDVELQPLPVALFSTDERESCSPFFVMFADQSTGATPLSYEWNFGDGQTSSLANPSHTYFEEGKYKVTLKVNTTSGCIADSIYTFPFELIVNPSPTAALTFTPSEASVYDPRVTVKSLATKQSGCKYLISDGTEFNTCDFEYAFKDSGTYTITMIVFTDKGCMDTLVSEFRVHPFFVPNVFTPNNDGRNDFFGPVATEVTGMEMSIYNRWGKLLYFTGDLNGQWDGTIQQTGEKATEGVYFYQIRLNAFNTSFNFTGHVTLIR
jgi:gliding motility-associated-like protein